MKAIHILFCYLFSFPLSLYATDLTFFQVSSQNGLSQNTVRAIVEDKNGFIWAGTLNGLNRYDGYNIRSYQPQLRKSNSPEDHRIRELFVDKDGDLWVKTYRNEFSCYNPVTDSFTHIKDDNEEPLTFLSYYESTLGEIWLWGKYDGVARIQKKNKSPSAPIKLISKSSQQIACNFLFEDSKSTIWIGGEFGLYNVTKDSVGKNYNTVKTTYTFTQATELSGKIYFSTQESVIVVYDILKKSFDEIKYTHKDPFASMASLSKTELIIVTKKQDVLLFDTKNYQFKKSTLSSEAEFARDKITLFADKSGVVCLFNNAGVVWYYNQQAHTFKRIVLNSKTKMIEIGQVFVDSTDLIWFITYGYGLFCYDTKNDKLNNYTYESVPNQLPSNYLLSMTEDRFGNLWVGSEYAGIIRILKTPDYIRIVRPEPNTIIGKTNNVRAIYEDSENNIWIGTKNGSLYVYESELIERKCIGEKINPYTLVEDDRQRMWVGTKGNGVYLYDTKTLRQINHFNYQANAPTSLSNDIIFHIIKDSKNRVWIGSFIGGLNLVEENGSHFSFKHFIQNEGDKSFIRYLCQDSKGMIWVGSSDGLIRFDPDELIKNSKAYTCYKKNTRLKHSLSSNDIKIIYEDKEHTIWIGTAGGGLNKFVEATEKEPAHFIAYTVHHGFVDNYVLGIIEHENNLWISSESGLSKFSKDGLSIVTYQFAQKSFGNIFNEGAFCQSKNGNMLWGNLDGLLVFNPEKFVPDANVPQVLLTGLLIDGIDWNEIKRKPFDKSITYTNNVELTYKQNYFSIEFATLNLRNPGENKYSYILENYDKEWCTPTHSNVVTYKNVPHGKYVFRVKGANSNDVWNNKVTTLVIIITPPFWKSPLAYIFYSVLIILSFYVILKLSLKFNRLNNIIEVEKQLTNHKLRFFTNISHEFRTPLTLIQVAVENLNDCDDLPPLVSKQVKILGRNSDSLRRLIDQLLEFRKLQNDVLTLNLEEIDVVAFVRYIYIGFQDLANQKSINYTFATSVESLPMFIDRKKIDMILYNLLSNAFKFTPKGSSIELLLSQDESAQLCVISVKDTGIGIPKEKQYLLFSRFAQINFSQSGTGIGLSVVKEFVEVHKGAVSYEENTAGSGSVFTVKLPTSKDVYKEENFIVNPLIDVIQDDVHSAISYKEIAEETLAIDSRTLADHQLLIIEDNDDMRNFLADKFSEFLHVDVAADGKEGLEKAIEINPDLILCDVMMPEIDGFEVTRRLKKEFQTCHIPIILLTAHSSLEHQLEGIESGADVYITKPFSLKYIVTRVMKLVEQREQLKKRFSKEFVIDGNLINTTDRDKVFFERIEKILDDNYENSDFTIDRFIELSDTRRTLFFKKVKGITGLSPNELIKIKRLNRGAVLLREGNLTVSEVSYKIGFEDPYYFSKCFKAHFDCTPSKFKNKGNT